MKPIIKYSGGKSKELPIIKEYIPTFDGKYIEPFFGGGALFFDLEPKNAIINDINERLINFYLCVRDDYDTFRKQIDCLSSLYKANREAFEKEVENNSIEKVKDLNGDLYYEIRDMFNHKIESKYLDGTLYYFINKTAFSGMIRFNSNGEFNVPYGRYKNFNSSLLTDNHHKLLQKAEIYNSDYLDIFNKSEKDDFIFLDPPYDCVFSDYGNEQYKEDGFNEECHRKLANDFNNLDCKSLMVIGATPLTRELYNGKIIHEYNKNYSVNIKNRFKAESKHLLITNY